MGEYPDQHVAVLPAGTWFGAEAVGSDVLVSAMVAPGFAFEDFELAERHTLIAAFPQHEEVIRHLTRE